MAKKSEKVVCLHISMTPYERDLIDYRAKLVGLPRSQYIVKTAAYGNLSFVLPLKDSKTKTPYQNQIHHSDSAVLETYNYVDSRKPRKAADNELRNLELKIRLSPYEKETIQNAAKRNGVSVTEYLLGCSVYRPPSNQPMFQREELIKVYRELRAQGRNLNQIAAAANSIASVAWREDVDGSVIDQACETLLEDNERTRAHINDANKEVVKLLARANVRSRK